MWLLVNALVLSMSVACFGKWQPVYLKLLSADSFDEFLQHRGGDSVRVVYFYSREFSRMKFFFTEMEKSAAIMDMYDTKFALVDCSKHASLGHCEQEGSHERVYLYRKGRLCLDVSRNAMFDVNSIVSNVLQVVLLMEVPILQSVRELEDLLISSKGQMDVIFSYQKALGTLANRILLEVIYAHRSQYRYGMTNEQEAVQNLPGYSKNEENGIWLLRCKGVSNPDQPCPIIKYNGAVALDNLAWFFRILDMTFIHYVGEDGDYNPFDDNGLHTVYLFYDKKTQSGAAFIANELIGVFFTQLGVIMVNVNEVNAIKFGFKTEWSLPTLVLKPTRQDVMLHMSAGDIPVRFIAESIGSFVSELNVIKESPSPVTNNFEQLHSENANDQDDEVANFGMSLTKAVRQMKKKHYFTELSSKTYNAAVNGDHVRRPLMVLFYVAFDAQCQVLLPIFDEVAKELTNNGMVSLAAVNCFDWTDLCQQVNVTVYPTLRVHLNKDKAPIQYSGMLSKKALIQAMKLYSIEVPQVLETKEEVDQFAASSLSDVVVLGAFQNARIQNEEIAAFIEVAEKLRGKLLLGLTAQLIAPYTCSKFNAASSCIIVIRHQDTVVPYTVLRPTADVNELITSIGYAMMDSFPELTVSNFPLYSALGQPFVIAFVNFAELTANNISGSLLPIMKLVVIQKNKADNCVYAWMDVSKSETALSILQHHVEEPRAEELLIINQVKGTVHHFMEAMSEGNVHQWIANSLSGGITATKLLTVKQWKPISPPFDFIAKIEAEIEESDSANIEEDEEAVGRSPLPFELLESNVENLAEEERSRLMRAQLYRRPTPTMAAESDKKANMHDEF